MNMRKHFLTICVSVLALLARSELGYTASEPPFLIHSCGGGGGMFAQFASVMGGLSLYEQGQLSGMKVNFIDGCYLDLNYGPNWWEYYFEPVNAGNANAPHLEASPEFYVSLAHLGFSLPRDYCNALISKHIQLKPEIEAQIQTYMKANFGKNFVIGLHYRGTDKILEYPRKAYDDAYNCLKKVVKGLNKAQRRRLKVYLATDEQQFVEYLSEKIGKRLIYNDFVRSNDTSTPLHYGNSFFSSNYQSGREAVVDCVLLSRSHILVKPTGTSFSWAASLFNAQLPVVEY